MAHSLETRLKARNAYVYEQASLAQSAKAAGVTIETVRRWRKLAEKQGDCWAMARSAYLATTSGMNGVTNVMLEKFTIQLQLTVKELEQDQDIGAEKRAECLSRLADAYTKTVKAAAGSNPKLAKLAIAMETIQHFSKFLSERHPDALKVFVPLLDEFGQYLTRVNR